MPNTPPLLLAQRQRALELATRGDLLQADFILGKLCLHWPQDVESWFLHAKVNLNLKRYSVGVICCQKALVLTGENVPVLQLLSSLYERDGNPEKALTVMERVLVIEPDSPVFLGRTASVQAKCGNYQAAFERIGALVDRGIINVDVALSLAQVARPLERVEQAIDYLQKALVHADTNDAQLLALRFAMGRLLDTQSNYEEAFHQFDMANKSVSAYFDDKAHERNTNQTIADCKADFLDRYSGNGSDSDRPVFIVGMPRSGSTLVENILASHSAVSGAGELLAMPQVAQGLTSGNTGGFPYMHSLDRIDPDTLGQAAKDYLGALPAAASGETRIVDKQLMNFFYLGLIELLFPNATVIHCRRNPMATCLSCYFLELGPSHPYAYDLQALGQFYRLYDRMMDHWMAELSIPVFEIEYETLVDDQETASRALIEFTGLDWEEQCLQFYESDRYSNTASYSQVKQPMYKTAVGRWKNYSKHLGALEAGLNNNASP